jgi:quercetin dioxygenase-like cupin family protein
MALISVTDDLKPFILRRSEIVPCKTAFIDARTPGSDQKENYCLIGAGVAENPDQIVHINTPHGFDVGAARQPKGCKNSHHSHDTDEVFVVHQGQWKFTWGEDGSDGETVLNSGDTISIPTQVFRGFENVGDDNGFLLSVLGHLPDGTPGSVTWAPYVFEEAKQYGLVLLQDGRLIDTHAGQPIPEDQPLYSPISGEELETFRSLTLEDMSKNVCRHAEFAAQNSGGLSNSHGAQEFSVIGGQSDPEGMPSGKISRPHNFQLRRLMLDPGASIPKHQRQEQEVIFVHRGSLMVTTDSSKFTLGTGDLFTCPIGLTRSFANEGSETADIVTVRGGDNPSAALFS